MKKEDAYHYTESGLDYVYLVGGVDYHAGPRGKTISIRDLEGLHRAIGNYLVTEKSNLSGPELRFLRHEMLMSQSTLAHLLKVKEQTIHRWESGKTEQIPTSADVLIRLLYNESIGNDEHKIKETLKRIANIEDEMSRAKLTMIEKDGVWKQEPKMAA